MNSHHLRKSEIQYELKIRGQPIEGTANDLRKRLTQCFSSNVGVVEDIVLKLEPETELEECEEKCNDLSSLVEEYDGSGKAPEGQRLLARLAHLRMRIDRIPINDWNKEELEESRSVLLNKTKALIDLVAGKGTELETEPQSEDGGDKKKEEDASTTEKKTEDRGHPSTDDLISGLGTSAAENLEPPRPNLQPTLCHSMTQSASENQSPVLQKAPMPLGSSSQDRHGTKAVPIYKWGLRFSNEYGQSVGAFLQRVEELRRARGITKPELFNSAVDLFSGSALVWYRFTIGRITSWESLCTEMKIVFQTADHDVRLQQEIFNRAQGENESIDMFIACMEGLYARLAISVPEETRLKQILHNLHPQLQDRLALFEVNSIEDLRLLGRKAEMGRRRATTLRPIYSNKTSLEPDLLCNDSSHPRRNHNGKLASLQARTLPQKSIKCWNCNNQGHRFATCPEPRTLFCYGCGARDTKKSTCTNCKHPKNV